MKTKKLTNYVEKIRDLGTLVHDVAILGGAFIYEETLLKAKEELKHFGYHLLGIHHEAIKYPGIVPFSKSIRYEKNNA